MILDINVQRRRYEIHLRRYWKTRTFEVFGLTGLKELRGKSQNLWDEILLNAVSISDKKWRQHCVQIPVLYMRALLWSEYKTLFILQKYCNLISFSF